MSEQPSRPVTPAGRRMLLLGAAVATLGIVVTLNLRGLEKNLIYYLDASELRARGQAATGAVVRLGGLVQKQSVHWDPNTLSLQFRIGMADEGEPNVVVIATGAPPQMFQEGIGAVVEGQYDGQAFHADRVMVKHSNEYRPPEPGESPSNLTKTLEAPLKTAGPVQPRAAPPLGQPNPMPTRYE